MTWRSQAGQDEWVFTVLGGLRRGFFVDVGAHDGVTHSNTFTLEDEHTWSGICIEPEYDAFSALKGYRPFANAICAAVSNQTGEILFDGVRVDHGGQFVPCDTLERILARHKAPLIIDYLSIDVEGHELRVLDSMDFFRWHVRAITIEHNLYSDGPERKDAIYAHLASRGFERVREDVIAPGYGPYEDWYLTTEDSRTLRV